MALGPSQVQQDLDLSFVKDRAGERGGIVCWVMSSGVQVVGYVANPIGAKPLGIQLNDVEEMDLSRHWHPATDRSMRRVDKPGATVGIAAVGTWDTNFIHPDANPYSGKKAYLAPSGLITDDISLGGDEIGIFLSSINDSNIPNLPRSRDYIVIYGGGWHRDQVFTKFPLDLPRITSQGELPTTIQSPGWARVKLRI